MGQGGETIANIRERSGARLQLEPEDRFAAERPLRIIGSEEQVKTARDMVIKLFEELDPAAAGVLAVSVRAMNSTDVISNLDQYRAQRREIPVPRAAVGRIIGRGGETIRRLQDSSGARIQFSDGTPRCRCVVACGVCVVVSPCPRFDGCAFACAPPAPCSGLPRAVAVTHPLARARSHLCGMDPALCLGPCAGCGQSATPYAEGDVG